MKYVVSIPGLLLLLIMALYIGFGLSECRWTKYGFSLANRMSVSAMCNDGAEPRINFGFSDLSEAQIDAYAERMEARLCGKHDGVFAMHKREVW